jgi:ribosome-binding ATPase
LTSFVQRYPKHSTAIRYRSHLDALVRFAPVAWLPVDQPQVDLAEAGHNAACHQISSSPGGRQYPFGVERIGLVGLPNSGKSSLFNALTRGAALVASHPFSTTETSTGIAQVPDHRLDALAVMSSSRKVVHAGVELVDIAGLVAGASTGEGLGNRFLGGIREADAICMVLRAFEDPNVPGGSDPLEDLAVLELELVLADLASAESQLERRRKAAKQDRSLVGQVAVLEKAHGLLADGTPLYRSNLDSEEREQLRPFFMLTNKPVLAVVNLGEDVVADGGSLVKPVADELGRAAEVLGVSVKLEAEAAQLPAEDRVELLEGLGLGEGALPRVAQAAYRLLGRRTFFTTGDKESRAWTFKAGAKAPECAGVIHSDLQRGFIRAEVVHWDELLGLGSWAAARDVGKLRVEGKEYEVIDGDVLEIRFNV